MLLLHRKINIKWDSLNLLDAAGLLHRGALWHTVFTQVLELGSDHLIQILINGDKLVVGGGDGGLFQIGPGGKYHLVLVLCEYLVSIMHNLCLVSIIHVVC